MEDYSENNIAEREILSVTEINKTANDFLNEAFPPLWVAGEISNFREYGTSGHWYFSIKDSESVLSCSMFRLQNNALRFKPKEGDQVILQGKLSIYSKSGRYQLIASKMELAGFGELMRQYEQLKNKLNTEGLFQIKLPENIPEIVSRVAIVTSPQGAAIRDVLSTLNRRAPHVEAIVVASKVQGEGSAASIKKALERVNVFSEQNAVDAVIVCRGGGSIEDLWSFNDEELCRYMAHYPLPVISGVGHETDFTLVDFVANTRAATPTAAAEIITEGASKLNDYFLYLKERLQKESTSYLRNLKEKIHNLSRLLKSPKQRLEDQYQRLDMISERLLIGMKLKISNKNANYSLVSAKLDALSPSQKIAVAKDRIRNAQNNLLEKIRMRLKNLENRILIQYEKISALNPNEILKRGYSITFDQDGTIIDDPSKLSKGDVLDTQLAKGKFKSQVID